MTETNPYQAPETSSLPPTNDDEPTYAGFWTRVGASLLDSILLVLLTVPLTLAIYGEISPSDPNALTQGPADILINWVFPVIAVIAFWIYRSATPGKMALKVKIIDAKTGGRPSVLQFIGRYFAYIISAIPLGLGYIWVGIDQQKRAWHDMLAGTLVVYKNSQTPENR